MLLFFLSFVGWSTVHCPPIHTKTGMIIRLGDQSLISLSRQSGIVLGMNGLGMQPYQAGESGNRAGILAGASSSWPAPNLIMCYTPIPPACNTVTQTARVDAHGAHDAYRMHEIDCYRYR